MNHIQHQHITLDFWLYYGTEFKLSYRYPAGCSIVDKCVRTVISDSSAVAASRQLLVITVTWTRTQVQNTNCDNTVKSDLVTYLLICCQKKSGPLNFQIVKLRQGSDKDRQGMAREGP